MRKKWTKEELIAFENHIGDLYMDNQLPFFFIYLEVMKIS